METIYNVVVEVLFDAPIDGFDAGTPDISGFSQAFGCTAASQDKVLESVEAALFSTRWLADRHPKIIFDINTIGPDEIAAEILKDDEIGSHLSGSPFEAGIWYRSQRMYFCTLAAFDAAEDDTPRREPGSKTIH